MAAVRHRYFFQDPLRVACLCSAASLAFLPDVPPILALLVVFVTQLAPIAMIARAWGPGWSRRWGRRVRESVMASSLALDFARLAACTAVGALLLVRLFNGMEVVRPLGILAAAVCLLPDVRLCRWLLSSDPIEASRQLREGYLVRDPALWGAMVASAAVLLMDPVSLLFVLLSLLILQVNTILVLVDKHLSEVEARRWTGASALLMEREGRRLMLVLAPLILVPVRLYGGDRAALYGAAAVVGAVLLPDALRLAWAALRAAGDLFRMTPAPASTYVVLPKP
jgi:hypothetical protein